MPALNSSLVINPQSGQHNGCTSAAVLIAQMANGIMWMETFWSHDVSRRFFMGFQFETRTNKQFPRIMPCAALMMTCDKPATS